MKKYSPLILLVLIAAFTAWWLLGNRTKVTDEESLILSNQERLTKDSLQEPPVKATSTEPVDDGISGNREEQRKRLEAAEELAYGEWRTPVNFYGVVVDENEKPVADAEISFGLNNIEGHSDMESKSDAEGKFSLTNKKGKHLSVKVSKQGYDAYKPNGDGYFYAGRNDNFNADPNNPIVFRLRKRKPGEPLITHSSREKIPLKGQSVGIDLMKGKLVAGGQGDMTLSCLSDYDHKTSDRKFDWGLIITVPGGGIIESVEQFDFEAPEGDYKPRIEINMPATMKDGWQDSIEKKFFLRLGNGKYARISIFFIAHNGVLRLNSFLNPSGSRNLEFDSTVNPKQTVSE